MTTFIVSGFTATSPEIESLGNHVLDMGLSLEVTRDFRKWDPKEKGSTPLHYKVRVKRDKRQTGEIAYSMGVGHLHGTVNLWKHGSNYVNLDKEVSRGFPKTVYDMEVLRALNAALLEANRCAETFQKVGKPELLDFLHCVISDARAMHQSFEDWASELGYDSDSRRAETAYRACCALGHELLKVLSAMELEELQRKLNEADF